MYKKAHITPERMARFDFEKVRAIKEELKTNPELATKLQQDFRGTLESKGIVIDEKFKADVMNEWKTQIRADLMRSVKENPKSKDWYLTRVLEGKPLRIHVTVNRTTGEKTKTLGENGQ